MYIYFSDTDEVREKQVRQRRSLVQQSTTIAISDSEAVMILVAVIQQQVLSAEDILALPKNKKSKMNLANIEVLMEYHGL